MLFRSNDTATTEIYTLSLHDALPICGRGDPNDKVLARLKKAEVEEPIGRELADWVVVNDDLDTTVDEMLSIIKSARGG